MAKYRRLYSSKDFKNKPIDILLIAFVLIKGKKPVDTTPPIILDDNNDDDSTSNEENEDRENRRKYKRHVGPHDNGGLQRTISTGQYIKEYSLLHFHLILFFSRFRNISSII